MLFPFRTDRALRRWPWINGALIAFNVVAYIVTAGQIQEAGLLIYQGLPPQIVMAEVPAYGYYLHPLNFWWVQLFSYQFLHADPMHLAGNMIFLWVFGNCVEDRLGKIGYLALFLGGGALAGAGHLALQNNPVIGASGSVAAVSGAFLALFPEVRISVLYFLIIIGVFEIPGKLLIAFYIVYDLVSLVLNLGGGVAYLAHLSGYAAGFCIGMALLKSGILAREPYDLLSTVDRYRRKREFKRLVTQGYKPWEAEAEAEAARERSGRSALEGLSPEARDKLAELQSRVTAALGDHDFAEAARLYKQMLEIAPQKVLSARAQLDVANQLMAGGDHPASAAAYHLLIERFPRHDHLEHAQLMLGLLYTRYLGRPADALTPLRAAVRRLTGAEREFAEQLLQEAAAQQ